MGNTPGKKWIHNPKTQEQKQVNPEDLPKYLSEGWAKGVSTKARENQSKINSGKKWIHNPKTQEEKLINPEDIQKYLSGGWVEGMLTKSTLGKKYIHNPSTQEQTLVNPEDLQKYLSEGWLEGTLTKATLGKKCIYNPKTQEQKFVNQEDLPKYLSGGWVEGASDKSKENMLKGRQELHADPERGPKARENNSKAQKELNADPERAEARNSKRYDTMKKNGTFTTSKSEEKLYKILLKQNPGKTILHQYREERYPFSCDFYIVEDDLFIELNGTWTHGFHPYNPEDPEDQKTLEMWREKAKTSNSYLNAIKTWTVRDIEKQNKAKENNLNYRMIYPDEYKKIVKQCA